IEISRLCTHPSYRRGDLLARIFAHVYRLLATSGREFIVTSTEEKLWPFYKRIGFKKTGLKYLHPTLSNLEHEVILVHVSAGTVSKGISAFVWGHLYGEMTASLMAQKLIRPSWFNRIKLAIYLQIGRIFKITQSKKY